MVDPFLRNTHSIQHSGTEIVDHNIGIFQQFGQLGLILRFFEVQGHGLFSPVDAHEIAALSVDEGAVSAGVVSLGGLDLDDLRSEVGEDHGTKGSG